MKSAIKALVFDAYGTLFDVHSVISACDRLFPGQGQALSQKWRAKQLEYTWLRSLMGRYKDFWQVTESALVFACDSLGLTCSPQNRAELMDSYLHLSPFPEVQDTLRALAKYRLAILSNGSQRMLKAAVKSANLKGIFSHVISVDEVRIYKPSSRVYRMAPAKLHLPKSAIGFISANSWDIAGAKAFGLQTFLVNRTQSPAEQLGLAPEATLNSLADLIGILRT